jgi:hypothetical protein
MNESELFPLHLCRILEREFEELHGSLSYEADWLFEEDQINNEALASKLDNPEKGSICCKIRESLWEIVNTRSPPDSEKLKKIPLDSEKWREKISGWEKTDWKVNLNKFLEGENKEALLAFQRQIPSRSLSKEKRSSSEDELREMIEYILKLDKTGQSLLKEKDRSRVNRLLLEIALPDGIKSIYNCRLEKIWKEINNLPKRNQEPQLRSALCLSGGGIRSASFALGVLQGLARYDLLRHFNYLSTVSGGGYIGSWLTAWNYRLNKKEKNTSKDSLTIVVLRGFLWSRRRNVSFKYIAFSSVNLYRWR